MQEDPAAPRPKRSDAWLAATGRGALAHRGILHGLGLGSDATQGRPVIGIGSSASDLNPCNSHLFRLARAVANGVWQAGGVPLVFPTMSLGEGMMRPTTMLYRNLMAMEVEETLRANPLDGVVLLSGCDKTTPAMLMALVSADLPGMLITGGAKLTGHFRGEVLGSGTSLWRFENDLRTGRMQESDLEEADFCLNRSDGHCMTMGTASTMACMVETLGMQLSGFASLPAVDKQRYALAHSAGHAAVRLVDSNRAPSRILTRASFENAIKVLAALGGSTNAIVHLLAIAGRAGVPLTLDDFDRLGSKVPLLADLMPSGRYLMEDFCYAGGLPALMAQMTDSLDLTAMTVSGKSLGEVISGAEVWNQDVIRRADAPVLPAGSGVAVLHGNLCPRGAVIKQSAASPELMKHRGRALVFESPEEYHDAVNDPDLPVEPSTVIVVRNAGPVGYPGMPEVANVPIPAKLLEQGFTDMVRISDGRMSGTAFGTVVLHVAPEAYVGGPLALVRSGDWIALDVGARTLDVELTQDEMSKRQSQLPLYREHSSDPDTPAPAYGGGYVELYRSHVLQADEGADFDILRGSRGNAVPRPSH
jgi:dihydroxy-acid dehydratase